MHPPTLPLHTQLLQMASGYWLSQCLYAAAKLAIADHLRTGEKHCDDLARLTETDVTALYRVLRALASVGVFQETSAATFTLTPLAEFLRSDHPRSMRGTVVMLGEPQHYEAWSDILHSVRTGESAFEHRYGQGIFEYFGSHPEAAAIFEEAMNSFSKNEEPEILTHYDFSSFTTIVDVGGGYGELLGSILAKYPTLKGILFDEDYVVDHAAPTLMRHGVGDRCQRIGGSFFETIPAGGDAYLLKHIIHDWGDEQAIAILKNCRAVLPDNGKILVCEMVVPEGNQPSGAKMLDINMLVMCPGGKERTAAEFETLLAAAGLQLTRIVRTTEEICVIEACKA
ncbi:O-methyltransferase, putative [[Synechococcus] sp. NIES-970]|nr:O-methyltransferase, putative [[Synechococcus] sp. NIES-970]